MAYTAQPYSVLELYWTTLADGTVIVAMLSLSLWLDMTSAASSTEPDPVLEVMSKLINEFNDVTQCNDVEVCRKYIELGQMDLNRAVEAYIDAMS